jgi:hypothetical protein
MVPLVCLRGGEVLIPAEEYDRGADLLDEEKRVP